MGQYLVEIYGTTAADSAVLTHLADGPRVRYVRSIVIPGDETCLHLVLADSIEDVAAAFELIGLDPDRIVDAVGLPERGAGDLPTSPEEPGERR
jgi:hypothetical protein